MDNKRIEHLKMIQEIIGRFSKYSFAIKSWNITLLTAFYIFLIQQINTIDIRVALLPLVFITLFLIIDAYYLMLEKSYRKLYKSVRKLDESEIDFNMEFHGKNSEIKYNVEKVNPLYGLTSFATILFYGFQIIIILTVYCYLGN